MVPCRIAGRRRPRCQLDERLQPLLCCRGKQASEAPVEQERQDRDTRLRAASTCHSHGGRFWPVDGLPLQRARVGCRSKGPMIGTRCALSRELGLRKAFSVAPELLASPDALGNLRLKSGRTECKPVLADLVDKAAALFGAKAHQPIERLFLRPIAEATSTSTGSPCQAKFAASMIVFDMSGRIQSGSGDEGTSHPQINSRQGCCGRSA